LVILGDWGFFHLELLYGRRDLAVINAEPLRKPEQFLLLIHTLARTKLKPAILVREGGEETRSKPSLFRVFFPGLVRAAPADFPDTPWTLWVEPESHDRSGDPVP